MIVYLKKSEKTNKKWMVSIDDKKIYFGQKGSSDFTINKDTKRKELYISRHKSRENWTKSGIRTAGFWARWLLWEKKTISEAIKNIEQKFNISIKVLNN